MVKENDGFSKVLEAARLLGDSSEEFAERSKLFRTRGLSLDTSWTPNFALEESLKAMEARGLLAPSSICRVAIIGPGLDFTDKARGYDFYPEQTLQPFALVDSLLRLGLAGPDSLEVSTLDLSERVNHHLDRAVDGARRGHAYTIELPRASETAWKPEAVRYWERFGDHIGVPKSPIAPPAALSALRVRAVSVRPYFIARISAVDLNVVLQHLDLPEAQRFDLIIATNVFVYYDVFEQSLAAANVERMLRSGGFLLSNNALLELLTSRLRSVGYLTTIYSDRADDGDHIVWYQRTPD